MRCRPKNAAQVQHDLPGVALLEGESLEKSWFNWRRSSHFTLRICLLSAEFLTVVAHPFLLLELTPRHPALQGFSSVTGS